MDLKAVAEQFMILGDVEKIQEYGSGHINRTYLVETSKEAYILQKINTHIFQNVDQLMENVEGVTSFLAKRIRERGGDPKRETLQLVKTPEGASYQREEDGSCYRMYLFITDASSYDAVKKPEDFYESAVAFGRFQALLADYPAETLHETIPYFHHTEKRFKAFCRAVCEDPFSRAESAKEWIRFVMERRDVMPILTNLLKEGELPLRVTHNDTKLNNVLIDNETGKGVCVIDLDTVMPGLSVNDFGDSIRFGANTALEDEKDLSKVSLDLKLYELYVKGYLSGCGGSLTAKEVELLPLGAKMMTLECGMRFLTDYLEGDTYFRIHREGHNLDRCATQFTLVADMEAKWDRMTAIVRKYAGQAK